MTEIEPLYDKKYECHICSNKFHSKKIRTRFVKLESTDTDFCPTYTDPENNPILYQIIVCPSCGYSFSEDFSNYFSYGTKEAIQDKVCSKWNPHHFSDKRSIEDAIKTYKLAIYCATLKQEKHIILAGLYIKLTWLYRYLGNDTQEQRFMNIALQEYFYSYTTQDFQGTQVSEIRVLYLLGELSIRTGNIKDASVHFSKVIEQQKKTTESRLVEMAKDRWNEVRHTKEFQLSTN
ncbi:DUF2225 domain-containing protein [Niallia sp. Krafla_26]|uniref:DUF2225 domain-containing protein n=1 Tax=Niallia sp. Krafla_26 TaxID=3064703 RepID=UPI003D16EDD1